MDSDTKPVAEQQASMATAVEKKKWVEPEITLHRMVQAVTLAQQCTNTFPACLSPQPINV